MKRDRIEQGREFGEGTFGGLSAGRFGKLSAGRRLTGIGGPVSEARSASSVQGLRDPFPARFTPLDNQRPAREVFVDWNKIERENRRYNRRLNLLVLGAFVGVVAVVLLAWAVWSGAIEEQVARDVAAAEVVKAARSGE